MRLSQEKRESKGGNIMETISGVEVRSAPCPMSPSDNVALIESEQFAGHFLTFQIADQRFALPLEQVVRVLRMVALIPVPEAPDVIAGLINIHGTGVPAINLRSRLGLAGRSVDVNDRILIIKTGDRTMGLIVESVEAVFAVTVDQIEKPRGSLVKTPLLQSLMILLI